MRLLHFILQPRCMVCYQPAASNAHWCYSCLRELFRARAAQNTFALLEYGGEATKSLLWEMRGDRQRYAIRFLGKLVASKEFLKTKFDYIATAPQAQGASGLDQFAKKLANLTNAKFIPNLFQKRKGHRQHGKRAKERLDTALFVYWNKSPNLIRGRRVLLIDDVSTTGTTLAQCRALLRRAEVAHVESFALARRSAVFKGESYESAKEG